jgi:uncharacterized protein YbjT (DUF2867 family)
MSTTDLVTGAFGFTGSRIAARLIGAGRSVRNFSRRADPATQAGRYESVAYDFSPTGLAAAVAGIDTAYITYWMRFPRDGLDWPEVVANVERLALAAAAAGVRRLVYFSVSNARHDSSTAYFRAKAQAEQAVRASGVSYAILRPTLLYGEGDILINNMAWTLRRLPLFGVAGDGRYRVQPVHVGDVADLALELARRDDNVEFDAAGPETFEFDDLVRAVASAAGRRARLIHLPPWPVLATTRLIGVGVRDVVLTRDELRELSESLLASAEPPLCPTRFSDWLAEHGAEIGRRYSSELARNFRLKA